MSSSIDADVRIILNAEDNASDTVRDAARRINTEFRDRRRENQALERSMILNNKTFFETANTISRIGNVAQRGVNIWQSYNIAQIRVADAKKNVRDITKELNQAMAEGDLDAVVQLTEELAEANAELARTEMDNNIQLALMIPAINGLVAQIPLLIPQIRILAHAYSLLGRNAKIAGGATALSGALGGLSAGGAGAAGAGAAGLAGGLGGRLKTFAGSTADKVIFPLAAGVATYEFLTETAEGQEINQYNPFKVLGDLLFMATHSPEDVAATERARSGATVNVYGASTSETMDYISEVTQENTVDE